MIKIDVIIKDDKGNHRTKQDQWTNLTVEQAIRNLREKYGVTRGFAGWLERMDDGIILLDKKLAQEFQEMMAHREVELHELKENEKKRSEGLARVRDME